MRDSVTLLVAGHIVDRFVSYRLDSDLYTADDAFSLTFAGLAPFAEGSRCEVWVNGRCELTGLIDRLEESCDAEGGTTTRVEGRDLLGLLVDSSCEEFPTLQGLSLKTLADRLLRTTPFLQRSQIVYQTNVVGRAKKKAKAASPLALLDEGQAYQQVEPGQTVFEVLSEAARQRGLLFYCQPDGTLVFGRPRAKGAPAFSLVRRRAREEGGAGNNVLSGTRLRDLSRRYSVTKVVGQRQGTDEVTPAAVNVAATRSDPGVPFHKPLVVTLDADAQSPAHYARYLVERARFEGFGLTYAVQGHSQDGANYAANELCRVEDEALGEAGTYLVRGRTFELDVERGQTTELRLGLPGLLA